MVPSHHVSPAVPVGGEAVVVVVAVVVPTVNVAAAADGEDAGVLAAFPTLVPAHRKAHPSPSRTLPTRSTTIKRSGRRPLRAAIFWTDGIQKTISGSPQRKETNARQRRASLVRDPTVIGRLDAAAVANLKGRGWTEGGMQRRNAHQIRQDQQAVMEPVGMVLKTIA